MKLSQATVAEMSKRTGVPAQYCQAFLQTLRRLTPAGTTAEFQNYGYNHDHIVVSYPADAEPWISATMGKDLAGRTTVSVNSLDHTLVIRESVPRGTGKAVDDLLVPLRGLPNALRRALAPRRKFFGRR